MNRSQRWRERRTSFVPDDTIINPSDYSVDIIDCYKKAKPFILCNHYSASFPATRLSCGLFRNGAGGFSELVGVASFAVPVNNASVKLYTGLENHNHAADLGRLVLLDDVPGNGESWFVSRAFKLLRHEKPEIQSIIAYSDPVKRRDENGQEIMPGHCGMIYQALSARFLGRSSKRTILMMPNGRLFSARALSKIERLESGWQYAQNQIIDAGGSERRIAEEPGAWINRLKAEGFFRKVRHPGNFVYAFGLTRSARIAMRTKTEYTYPRKNNAVHVGDVSALPLEQEII